MTRPSYGDGFVEGVGIDPGPVQVATGAYEAWECGRQSTHAWYRNHAIEIHSGVSPQRCWARVVLILHETPFTWSELKGWPPGKHWGRTTAEAVAAATDTAKAWIDAKDGSRIEPATSWPPSVTTADALADADADPDNEAALRGRGSGA